jgi:DNA-binding response OmpR family regulator
VAFDGEEAIDVYGRYKDKIDVVLLDLGLPGLAGWDVLVKLKDQTQTLKSSSPAAISNRIQAQDVRSGRPAFC